MKIQYKCGCLFEFDESSFERHKDAGAFGTMAFCNKHISAIMAESVKILKE